MTIEKDVAMSRAPLHRARHLLGRLPLPSRRALAGVATACVLAGGAVLASASSSSGQPAATHSSSARDPGAGAASGAAPGPGTDRVPSALCPDTSGPTGSTGSTVGTATHLFTRTTADGITIRAYQLADGGIVACVPVPQSTPALPACGGGVSAEMSDTTAVGQGDLGPVVVTPAHPVPLPASGAGSGSTTTTEPGWEQAGASTSGAFGVVEGDPVWWVMAQVPADVTQARMTFADGSTDAMAPVGGVVVLAHHVAAGTVASDPYTVSGTLQLLGAGGTVLSSSDFPPTPVSGNSGPGNSGTGNSGTGNSGPGNSGPGSSGTGNSGPGAVGSSGSGNSGASTATVSPTVAAPSASHPPAVVNDAAPAIAVACPMLPAAS
ncbi:MAG TPA: pentapeptide repeat-containing protein [Acidimicrobiales bacterium]|nr:pentapeptide repeat-containing protein [Acidimicrobiales bacterium]